MDPILKFKWWRAFSFDKIVFRANSNWLAIRCWNWFGSFCIEKKTNAVLTYTVCQFPCQNCSSHFTSKRNSEWVGMGYHIQSRNYEKSFELGFSKMYFLHSKEKNIFKIMSTIQIRKYLINSTIEYDNAFWLAFRGKMTWAILANKMTYRVSRYGVSLPKIFHIRD